MFEQRLPYRPIVDRPPLVWPGGARLAVWVCPNVEHYEYQPDPVRLRDPWPRTPHPDLLGYASKDYGNRAGLWRLMAVMDRHGIRCTTSLNLAAYEHYPEIRAACEARGWDILCHGIYNTQYLWNLDENAERAVIADCVATHQRLTGRPLRGWFSPANSHTLNTPDLVKEAGIDYYCDWCHDDQPTLMQTRAGPLLTLPYTMDANDAVQYPHRGEGDEFARIIRDQFDQLLLDAKQGGRVMNIAVHPYISGQPQRIRALDAVLGDIARHPDVWLATGAEIARASLPQLLAAAASDEAGRKEASGEEAGS